MEIPNCEHCNVFVELHAEIKRLDEAIKANFDRLTTSLGEHITYTKERFNSEMKRIADVRLGDVGNVATASATATETAAVLAKKLEETDQTARTLVSTTAEAAARRQEQFAGQIQTQMAALNDARLTSKGREGLSAPLMMLLCTLAGGLILFVIQNMM